VGGGTGDLIHFVVWWAVLVLCRAIEIVIVGHSARSEPLAFLVLGMACDDAGWCGGARRFDPGGDGCRRVGTGIMMGRFWVGDVMVMPRFIKD
jgi:hypothetical protein